MAGPENKCTREKLTGSIEKTKENPRLNIPVFGNGDLFSTWMLKEKKIFQMRWCNDWERFYRIPLAI